ncbi:hypothetical protein [Pseudomonas sp. CFBP 13719]|uniref:hypothetical protein n=1 Tax=Pseudomonas sp. CFBP 13719 TaxID=2775303 RepID=UPI001785B7E4|nr:hypothetical protein [Pseudomonas sp. CFBP 13719]MBD8614779.1 hypothetical protein [Pseudomonas putida]MBD8681537.1 hypothetical protein [Pseudomonas sp. CFBP 13719]
MFANHSAGFILSWINKGMQIQKEEGGSPHFLSAENHLVTGFVADQCAQGKVLACDLPAETAQSLSVWIESILNDSSFLDPITLGAFKLLAAGDGEDKLVRIDGGCSLAEIAYDATGLIKAVQVEIAQGLLIGGRDRLWRAQVGDCTLSLNQAHQIPQMLQSAILLAVYGHRKGVEGFDQREVVLPEGAAAVVEVGLYGSLKIVWAEAMLGHSIREDGYMEVFDALEGLAPGRYVCTATQQWENHELLSEPYLLSEVTGYRLVMKDQMSIHQAGAVDWVAATPGDEPDLSELEEEALVHVRLHSGDVLHPMALHEINWGAIGLGTVAQYKLSKSSGVAELVLYRRLQEIFQQLQSSRPFLTLVSRYTRSEDWVIEVEDKSPRAQSSPLSLVCSHVDNRVCHSMAIQALLAFAQD